MPAQSSPDGQPLHQLQSFKPPLKPHRGSRNNIPLSHRTNDEDEPRFKRVFKPRKRVKEKKKRKTKAKTTSTAATQTKPPTRTLTGVKHAHSDIAATSVPVPIPDDGPGEGIPMTPTPGGTPLGDSWYTMSESEPAWLATRVSTYTVWVPASTSSVPINAAIGSPSSSSTTSQHLPVVIMVLIAVGSFSFIVGSLILCKCLCFTHQRRAPPTPSAPILQDSPLFGGMERFSARFWGAPSYPSLPASASANTNKAGVGMGHGKGWKQLPDSGSSRSGLGLGEALNEKKRVPPPRIITDDANSPPMSAMSVYPVSPASNFGGSIVDNHPRAAHATADIQPLKIKDKEIKPGSAAKRRQSVAYSIYGDGNSVVGSTYLAYQAPRPAPSLPKPALKTSAAYRERIQAPYQGYPKSSNTRSANQQNRDSIAFQYAVPTTKTPERRDRDTKALTSALGLATPPPPSPCPPSATHGQTAFSPVSLYPDDSLSVAHGDGRNDMASPGATHAAALGSMMLQEFPSLPTMASTSARNMDAWGGGGSSTAYGGTSKAGGSESQRSKAGPPRVPSPPPLPSLAQMAWENADPDYRSPTYSIYGLYEAQRKSSGAGAGTSY
ncbi:hypothetical protein BD410DRAFT_789630 [Rickenella mellea]|uniref:Uncharacterized protein n=1 Tax=Rickenella mellea TaxID=50990 RepID=A0A4Y7Q273_9AGAM|nr:hypothetical protein BD410DRAFT_789630 [Rickenella mellea]